MNNDWVTKPKQFKIEIDKDLLSNKIKNWTEKIDKALESDEQKTLDDIKNKLKEYRQSGLEKEGELSYENLVFKFLRRSGHIQKLFDKANNVVDKELSIERKMED
jgi:hypothetical protein